ncbi:hypothetical protein LCGC14_2254280 [marine sediment metagenome]|uniref:Uncharacterized protein n=1 Tax=marine sediment metagenome TaxID=412755 RepID=A0A0F9D1F2_9ZZZZ
MLESASTQKGKEDEIINDWFQEFLNKLTNTPEVNLKNENLVISTLIREIEYEFHLKDSKLYYGKLDDLININFKMTHYLLREQLKNVFSGPKFILLSNRNKPTIISGVLNRNEYIIVLGH